VASVAASLGTIRSPPEAPPPPRKGGVSKFLQDDRRLTVDGIDRIVVRGYEMSRGLVQVPAISWLSGAKPIRSPPRANMSVEGGGVRSSRSFWMYSRTTRSAPSARPPGRLGFRLRPERTVLVIRFEFDGSAVHFLAELRMERQ